MSPRRQSATFLGDLTPRTSPSCRSFCGSRNNRTAPVEKVPGGHTSDIQSAPKCSDWGMGALMSMQAAREYHLICRTTGQSHGGFETLAGARLYAREEGLEAWDIFQGNLLVERPAA